MQKLSLLSFVGFIIYNFFIKDRKKVSIDRMNLSQVKDVIPLSCTIQWEIPKMIDIITVFHVMIF